MVDEQTIVANLKRVRDRMQLACEKAGRDPAGVALLLATKTVPADVIAVAVKAGANLLAENQAQEFVQKRPLLAGLPITWHFIGHLQTNKVRSLVPHVACIQSVDRLSLVAELHKQMSNRGLIQDVLIEVNTSGAASKQGVAPAEALAFVRDVARYTSLRVQGLMTIGPLTADTSTVRDSFRTLRELGSTIQQEGLEGVQMKELSMGMSGDFELAIAEGATIVRVGTAVFGHRPLPA
ncbi:MAG: YggS family pyridoxal phosphate-dependent enzyme [Dehalococcoidia bacterium]|nr:YggS family pyridoxal phosphate-dependent enzyme [Dehalococcoidia bacterium]